MESLFSLGITSTKEESFAHLRGSGELHERTTVITPATLKNVLKASKE